MGLLVNTFAADEKYIVFHMEKLTIDIQMQLSQNHENCFLIFCCIFQIYIKFWNILKTKMTLPAFVYLKLQAPKTWLDKCLKSPVSEDASTSNMVNVPKHCRNLHHRPFMKFTDSCPVNLVGKSLDY